MTNMHAREDIDNHFFLIEDAMSRADDALKIAVPANIDWHYVGVQLARAANSMNAIVQIAKGREVEEAAARLSKH